MTDNDAPCTPAPGDVVRFTNEDGEDRYGTVLRLNPSGSATIDAGGGCVWVTKAPLTLVTKGRPFVY